MIKLIVKKIYEDVELKREMRKGEIIEVSPVRALYLLGRGLVDILSISKLSNIKNEATKSASNS